MSWCSTIYWLQCSNDVSNFAEVHKFKSEKKRESSNVQSELSFWQQNTINRVKVMAEVASRSVRKMTHGDWLPSRAISFSDRLASFGRKISRLI